MNEDDKALILLGVVHVITGCLIIATGVRNEQLECNDRKDDYVDEEKYPKDYFKGVWGSGIAVIVLSVLFTYVMYNKCGGKGLYFFSWFNFWCFIINVWLVINAGFYDMQIERCNDYDGNEGHVKDNRFFLSWGGIVIGCFVLAFLNRLIFLGKKA